MLVEVSVTPNSKKFSISVKDGLVKIYLRNSAERNKANLELVKELSKRIGASVKLISGERSRKKILEIDMNENEWNEFLNYSNTI